MNFNENDLKTEENIMETIRGIIPKIVEVRLASSQMRKWLAKQGAEYAISEEEITEAIEALYKAESALGNAHQSILIAHATRKVMNNAEK